MRYRLIVFDFDGTLCDTDAVIVASARAALAGAGFPAPEPGAVRALVGLGLDRVMATLAGPRCTPDHVADLCARYRAHFAGLAPSPLFAGVPDLLGGLRGRAPLAVATGRSRPSLEAMLDHHRMRGDFGFLIGGTCVREGKPHPEMLLRVLDHFAVPPEDALMVGDTTYDLDMGRAAGTATCAVTYGHHPRDTLEGRSPTHVVDRPADVLRVVNE